MSDWTKVASGLPAEDEFVEIRLVGGQTIKGVEFASGRFWKYRSGNGGHAYNVEAWRPIKQKGKGDAGRTESTD